MFHPRNRHGRAVTPQETSRVKDSLPHDSLLVLTSHLTITLLKIAQTNVFPLN